MLENIPFKSVLIVGCGDVGHRVARLWLAHNVTVYGLARSEQKQQAMSALGILPIQADLDVPATLEGMPSQPDLLYWFAPPPTQGKTDPRMKNFLACLGSRPKRVVAISTSGVYGDQQGRMVSEETPPNPQVDRAYRRLDMERQLQAWGEQYAVPIITLRVGGIYGPGRLPLKRIRDGVPILKETLAPKTNRIHVDDLAQVCFAAAFKPQCSRIYNVSDGQESNMTEYFFALADHFGLPRPPEVDWNEAEQTISKGMLSYLRESRRMDNRRMLQELAIKLRYPGLEEGLNAMTEESK